MDHESLLVGTPITSDPSRGILADLYLDKLRRIFIRPVGGRGLALGTAGFEEAGV